MTRTFKTELINVDAEQRSYFDRAIGIRRWTFNWGLAEYLRGVKEDGEYQSNYTLQKKLNNTLVKDPEYSWLTEINSMVRQESLKDLTLSTIEWSRKVSRAKSTMTPIDFSKGMPKFKKRGKGNESFRYSSKADPLKIKSNHKMTLTRVRPLKPLVLQTKESVEFLKNVSIKETTISRNAGKYYISIVYEKPRKPRPKGHGKVGIDMGIKTVAVAYDGTNTTEFNLTDNLRKAERRTEKLHKALARTKKDSNNHRKIQIRLQKAYERENNIKKDFREKFTTHIVSNYDEVNLESFAFTSAKNLNVNRALHRVGVYATTERLKQKAAERGVVLKEVPKGTPTTQTCSSCNYVQVKKVELKHRTFDCESCSNVLDRDENAARNIYNLNL